MKKIACLAIATLIVSGSRLACIACCVISPAVEGCGSSETIPGVDGSAVATFQETAQAEHSCCKLPEQDDYRAVVKAESKAAGATSCCLVPGGRTFPAVLPQSLEKYASLAKGCEPIIKHSITRRVAAVSPRAPALNREGTYLRCCALLI